MNKFLAALMFTASISMISAAYGAGEAAQSNTKVNYKDNGGYESSGSSSHIDTAGTKKTSDVNVDVDVDSKGNVEKKVEAKSTTDPKGLLNKKGAVTKTEEREKDNGGFVRTTTTKQTDANGTNITENSKVDVDVDAQGNVEKTVTDEKTVDPKGLMNKTKTVSKTKSVNGQVVENTRKTN